MKCDKCDRENLTAKELAMHNNHFHTINPREVTQQPAAITTTNESCPDCGRQLRYEEGCKHCIHCGFSKCG